MSLKVPDNVEQSKENCPQNSLELISLLELCSQMECYLHARQLSSKYDIAGWNVLIKNNECLEIGKLTTVNKGCGILLRINICKDMNWKLFYGPNMLDTSSVQDGIPDKITCLNDLIHILSFIENLRICHGIKYMDYDVLPPVTKNISGSVVGQYDPLQDVDDLYLVLV